MPDLLGEGEESMNKRNCVPRVLIVDDDLSERETTKRNLQPLKYELYVAEGTGSALLEDARRKVRELRCHVAVVDMRLLDPDRDDRSGLDLMPQLAPAKCVVLTAYPSHEVAVQALRQAGAFDFLNKADGPQRLRETVEEAVKTECNCWLSIHWPEGWSPQRVVKDLGLHDAGAPQDEPLCLLGRLFSGAAQIVLETIEGQVRTPTAPSRRARSVVLKARERREGVFSYDEPVVVKIAPQQSVVREVKNYDTFVRGRIPNYQWTRLERDRQTWDLGGIVYTFMGSSVDQMKRFDQYYRLEQESSRILRVLHELFRTTFRNWFESAPSPSVREIFSLYVETLGLDVRLQEYPNRKERIVLPGLPFEVRNPIVWAEKHARASALPDVRMCTTHGDLHAGNVLVDERGEPWLIGFEWTGEGHILGDAVELEADIKFRLLELHPSDETHLTYALEVSLLQPESATDDLQPAAIEMQNHPEFHKAISVVTGLRRVLHEVTGFQDMREYYWALLCASLDMATDEHLLKSMRDRALLSAALICERLARWREPWPPQEWPKTL
jgi:ActR/RegA family two-component response regulator